MANENTVRRYLLLARRQMAEKYIREVAIKTSRAACLSSPCCAAICLLELRGGQTGAYVGQIIWPSQKRRGEDVNIATNEHDESRTKTRRAPAGTGPVRIVDRMMAATNRDRTVKVSTGARSGAFHFIASIAVAK